MAYNYSNTSANVDAVAGRVIALGNAGGSPGANPSLNFEPLNDRHKAIADAYLDSFGYRAQEEAQAGSDSRNANTFADATTAFGTWTVTVPIAKTYLLHVDVSCYLTGAADAVAFQVMVDGSAVSGQPVYAARFHFNTLSEHNRLHWTVPISFGSAGSKAIKLQWRVVNAVGTVTTNGDDFRLFTLVG